MEKLQLHSIQITESHTGHCVVVCRTDDDLGNFIFHLHFNAVKQRELFSQNEKWKKRFYYYYYFCLNAKSTCVQCMRYD